MENLNNDIPNINHLADETLAEYVDAIINNTQHLLPDEILTHIDECLVCKQAALELMEITDFIEGEKTDTVIKNTTTKKSKIRAITYLTGVAAAIALLIFSSIKQFKTTEMVTNVKAIDSLIKQKDSIKTIEPEGIIVEDNQLIIAENKPVIKNDLEIDKDAYTEFIIFETAIKSNYRNHKIVNAFKPKLGIEFQRNESIFFEWDSIPNTQFELIIYNNKGKEVFSKKEIDTNHFTIEPMAKKGLYYWKLKGNSELLVISKFQIK